VLVPGVQIYNSVLSMIGILDNNFLHNYDACSLIALRAVNAIGAPSCLYYAYHRCQQLLLQVSFNHNFDIVKCNTNFITYYFNCCQNVKHLYNSKKCFVKF
jgi:hypothetical protein